MLKGEKKGIELSGGGERHVSLWQVGGETKISQGRNSPALGLVVVMSQIKKLSSSFPTCVCAPFFSVLAALFPAAEDATRKEAGAKKTSMPHFPPPPL